MLSAGEAVVPRCLPSRAAARNPLRLPWENTYEAGGSSMSLPVLDHDSYQFMSSEWVMYAGQLLRDAGYL